MNDSNIKRVANLYTAYQRQHAWQGPKDEADFKSFIARQMPSYKLDLMGVDPENLDASFFSARDGKPFRVKYGVKGGFRVIAPVVFEEEGMGQRRQVGFTNSVVIEELDDARYQQLWNEKAPTVPAPINQQTGIAPAAELSR